MKKLIDLLKKLPTVSVQELQDGYLIMHFPEAGDEPEVADGTALDTLFIRKGDGECALVTVDDGAESVYEQILEEKELKVDNKISVSDFSGIFEATSFEEIHRILVEGRG